ncbi:MAG: hypothetical protein ABSF55_03055 [Candidatus Staskawiczbacteria bacterium]|jgi:hypothetical protein
MEDEKKLKFNISDLNFSAFLLTKGSELLGISHADYSKRCDFIFKETPRQEKKLREAFYFAKENAPEALVDARKLVANIKSLKDKVYQYRNGNDAL